jgi:phage terminase large subunit GpA-like protein
MSTGRGDVPAWEEIFERARRLCAADVPDDARYLTCGVDVQKNRLVFVVRAWGARATSWLVQHGELWGDTSQPEVWEDLAQLLTTPIDGDLIKLAFIDSGFRPGKKEGVPVNRVYEFCRRFRRFAFPTKGSSVALVRPLVKSTIEVTQQGTAQKYGLELIRLDPDHWKSFVHERLKWPLGSAWRVASARGRHGRLLPAAGRGSADRSADRQAAMDRTIAGKSLPGRGSDGGRGRLHAERPTSARRGLFIAAEQGHRPPAAAPTSAPALPLPLPRRRERRTASPIWRRG